MASGGCLGGHLRPYRAHHGRLRVPSGKSGSTKYTKPCPIAVASGPNYVRLNNLFMGERQTYPMDSVIGRKFRRHISTQTSSWVQTCMNRFTLKRALRESTSYWNLLAPILYELLWVLLQIGTLRPSSTLGAELIVKIHRSQYLLRLCLRTTTL